ncbi:small membrane protein YldA [Phytobacter sp. AG2a]|jgi:hypothetical protein
MNEIALITLIYFLIVAVVVAAVLYLERHR